MVYNTCLFTNLMHIYILNVYLLITNISGGIILSNESMLNVTEAVRGEL